MTESASHVAKPAKSSLGKHALLLFMGLILLGNLYVIFSLREKLLSYEDKIHDIQSNTNLISDRVYDLDTKFTAEEVTLTEIRSGINETTVLLELTQQEVDDTSNKLTAAMTYLDQLAEAVNFEERLDIQESGTLSTQGVSPITPASEQPAVDPEGSMEWTDATGKKHTVKFRSGRVLETIE
jgi:uncharacterized coiled-coil protein SlyX